MENCKKQYIDLAEMTLYTFGESTIEVDFVKVDEVPEGHPFARIKTLDPDYGMKPADHSKDVAFRY